MAYKKGFSLHCQAVFQDTPWTFMTTMFNQPFYYQGEKELLIEFLDYLTLDFFYPAILREKILLVRNARQSSCWQNTQCLEVGFDLGLNWNIADDYTQKD